MDLTFLIEIHSRLSRCSTARGSNTGLFQVGPTKVKARKSFLLTEGSLKVEIITLVNNITFLLHSRL